MKAARFYERHNLQVDDIPVKAANERGVVIKVHYCGVCGTDVHIYEGEKGSAEVEPPIVLGHELSGEVVEIGDKVTRVKVGDRVAVDPNEYCGQCYYCNIGKKHMCNNMIGLGTARDGGFAEFITVPEYLVYPIPDNVSYKVGAMIEPISCCLHGINLIDINLGDTVMVVGTGNIGLIMVQLAKNKGASVIIAVEPNDVRREKAIKFGAAFGINPVTDDTDEILAEHKIENVDVVIDCAGRVNTCEYSVKYAGKGAQVMLFGLTGPDDEMTVKPFSMFKKELTIKASFVNPDSFEKSIALLSGGNLKVDEIISDIVDLDDINTVFEQKLYAKDGKVLIKCCQEAD